MVRGGERSRLGAVAQVIHENGVIDRGRPQSRPEQYRIRP